MNRIITLSALVSLGLSTPALAHDDNCNVELDGNILYERGVLTVDMDNGSTMTITPDHNLTVNGEAIGLDSQQQRWVSDYYTHIDTAIPMSVSIAADGLALATTAVDEVFGELFGADNDVVTEFNTMFADMSAELDDTFYDENGAIRINSREMRQKEWMEGGWENEFEDRVEEAIAQSMGKILVALGTQLMWEGGDMEAFEAKMDRFGESIETRVERQALKLEKKADQLCQVLADADEAETQMQRHIPGLDGLNLMDVSYHGHADKM
ncbi:DUF2884 family protein [Alteromonas halophila]|uniref:DUF2884 family protein n=1 Tax=Alteromonas halophila TaxID=516698 RepID=A0A918JPA7_9ALTE|nr:DUF2884 family protein [Alteromonas halophila]GGW91857.1 hypothetical protein GCM10007391_27630 [Alteromonas halophila]